MGIEAKYSGLPCDCDCSEGECQYCLHRAELARLREENERLREAIDHRAGTDTCISFAREANTLRTRVEALERALRLWLDWLDNTKLVAEDKALPVPPPLTETYAALADSEGSE